MSDPPRPDPRPAPGEGLPAPALAPSEWPVMQVLWEEHPLGAQEVAQRLDPGLAWSPRTVKTLLARLVQKGALDAAADGPRYLYRPRVGRAACIAAASRSFLERVGGGSPSPLLVHFLRESELSAAEIAELRRILEEKEREG